MEGLDEQADQSSMPDEIGSHIEGQVGFAVPEINITKAKFAKLFDYYVPEKLIDLIGRQFPDEYNSDLQLIDGDNLGQHSSKVLNQFEKYFASKKLPLGMDKNVFRLVLALHDIGKPKALKEQNKDLHHEYSAQIIGKVLGDIDYNEAEIRLAMSLVSKDPIGSLFKRGSIKKCASDVIEMAKLANVDPVEFLELLIILFTCDASSYTEDAGSKRNLDHLFVTNDQKGMIDFSPFYSDRIEDLFDEIDNIMEMKEAA